MKFFKLSIGYSTSITHECSKIIIGITSHGIIYDNGEILQTIIAIASTSRLNGSRETEEKVRWCTILNLMLRLYVFSEDFSDFSDVDSRIKRVIVASDLQSNENELDYLSKSESNDASWMLRYKLLEKYFEEFGNCNVPFSYSISMSAKPQDIDTSDTKIRLGYWLYTQRRNYRRKELRLDRFELLNKLYMEDKFKW